MLVGWIDGNARFNPRALTSPDREVAVYITARNVSIHGLLRALTSILSKVRCVLCFNPRALTSPDYRDWKGEDNSLVSIHGLLRALTADAVTHPRGNVFQSTGSYEP